MIDDLVIHGTLTWQQRQVVFRGHSSNVLHAARDLKRPKRQTEDGPQEVTPPTKAQLTGFLWRFRKKLRQPNFEPRSLTGLDASAFQYCMDQASGSLGGSTLLLPDDARVRIQDTQLRVLNPVFNGSELSVPIICTALVNLVLSLVPRPWHIKLSLDGTYRLVICSKYVLLNAGVNVKHWVHDRSVTVPEFRSRFVPLAFAIPHVEAEGSYARLTDSLLKVRVEVSGQDGVSFDRAHIGQWRGDSHRGLEKTRRAVVPDAVRLSDWAHCCGVTCPGLAAGLRSWPRICEQTTPCCTGSGRGSRSHASCRSTCSTPSGQTSSKRCSGNIFSLSTAFGLHTGGLRPIASHQLLQQEPPRKRFGTAQTSSR